MGHLLTKVKSTNKGLVGITLDDKKIFLSTPEPQSEHILRIIIDDLDTYGDSLAFYHKLTNFVVNELIRNSNEDIYFQLGNINFNSSEIIQPYNTYTKIK